MARLDMTPMYVMHDALRRELEHLAKATARMTGDPRRVLAAAAGWDLFKTALHGHHSAEDEALWPVMRETLASRPDDLALLDAMEAEHAAIDPIIEAIDHGTEPIGDLVEALASALTCHLRHEEEETLPLMDAVLTAEQLRHFGQVHRGRLGPDTHRVIPWLLDGATDERAAAMLASLPEQARAALENDWRPAYEAMERWPVA